MNTKLTPEKKLEFLEELSKSCNVSKACVAVGISRTSVYNERDEDALFADGWVKALKIGVGALEDEAHRRAFDGTLKITKHGTYMEYSDTLAIFLLKSHDPKYKETVRNELTGANGEPLNMTDEQIGAKLSAIMQVAMARRDNVPAPVAPEQEDDYSDIA